MRRIRQIMKCLPPINTTSSRKTNLLTRVIHGIVSISIVKGMTRMMGISLASLSGTATGWRSSIPPQGTRLVVYTALSMILVSQWECTGGVSAGTGSGCVCFLTATFVVEGLRGRDHRGMLLGDFAGHNIDEEIKHIGLGDGLSDIGSLESATF